MTVKIVTDTLSDIPDDVANKLGITLIPLTVSFGHESFLTDRDYLEEFYEDWFVRKLFLPQHSHRLLLPMLINLAEESDEILVITLSVS